MIKYKIRFSKSKKPYPIIEFSESTYAPIGTFLLAERPIISEIIKTLKNQTDETEISGNVFTLSVNGETSTITDDIKEIEFTFPTAELTEIAEAYKKALTAKPKNSSQSQPQQ